MGNPGFDSKKIAGVEDAPFQEKIGWGFKLVLKHRGMPYPRDQKSGNASSLFYLKILFTCNAKCYPAPENVN